MSIPFQWHTSIFMCMTKNNDIFQRISFYVSTTYSVASFWPLFGSQRIIGCWESLLPETRIPLWGCQSTHLTSQPWPYESNSNNEATCSREEKMFTSEFSFLLTGQKIEDTNITIVRTTSKFTIVGRESKNEWDSN